MALLITMPQLSSLKKDSRLTKWFKKEGDRVSIGEPLAEIETDLATLEVRAQAMGILHKIFVSEGEIVPVGKVMAIIAEADDEISEILNALRR
jgi:pyruvate/2-oxoglutarate dehydrogenase complex dihydrolipoamide acyltransferase (E2) component